MKLSYVSESRSRYCESSTESIANYKPESETSFSKRPLLRDFE
jgi:hypothetical protein